MFEIKTLGTEFEKTKKFVSTFSCCFLLLLGNWVGWGPTRGIEPMP